MKENDQRKLEKQKKISKNSHITDVFTIMAIAVFVFSIGIVIYMPPFNSQKAEDVKIMDILTTDYISTEFSDHYSRNFPGRDFFVGVKGASEIAMLKFENNGVAIAKNGYNVMRDDYPNYNNLRDNVNILRVFSDVLSDYNIQFLLALNGRPVDSLKFYLPPFYPHTLQDDLWTEFKYQASGMNTLDLLEPLKNRTSATQEQLFYRTDNNLTTLGAYYAYVEIARALDIPNSEIRSINDFTVETAADNFRGKLLQKSGFIWTKSDTVERFRFDGDDIEFITYVVDTQKMYAGFYDDSYLENSDKYGNFISGQYNPRVNINKVGERRETLLILTNDGAANAIVPFLANHYNLIVINPQYYDESIIKLAVSE